jgi:hypothetical protein
MTAGKAEIVFSDETIVFIMTLAPHFPEDTFQSEGRNVECTGTRY